MIESETTRDLNEQPDSEIEETYSLHDPGFLQTSQVLSDDEKILDF